MAKIIAPNSNYNGVSASLCFVNGEAETENKWLIEWFKNNGYKVEEAPQQNNQQDSGNQQQTEKPIENLTKDEIKSKLDELQVEYDANANKETLLEILKEKLSE